MFHLRTRPVRPAGRIRPAIWLGLGLGFTNYSYSVNPASPSLTGPLHTGGGTA
jgi:hypothetical protein